MNKKNRLFYSKLAASNIKKNLKTYIPFMLTAICTIMMFYTIIAISTDPGLKTMKAGTSLSLVLGLGVYVIGIFAVIFLFYTNSFLIKRRKKELGLYNILGMAKRHIARMLSLETLFVGLISLAAGLFAGIVGSKLMFLILLKILNIPVTFEFSVSPNSIIITVILFSGIFLINLLFNLGQIQLSKPIQLLSGSKAGEKEPKTKWIMAIIGTGSLGAAYYLAMTVEDPLMTLLQFFVAVILVIIGTYFLFIAGSIAILKLLRKNKKFYYKLKNFTAVSGLLHRMKQNAAGLASICILSTCILVMFTSSVSLYLGVEDLLDNYNVSEISVQLTRPEVDEQATADTITATAKKYSLTPNVRSEYYSLTDTLMKTESGYTKKGAENATGLSELCSMQYIFLEDYNRIENLTETLEKDEILVYVSGIPTGGFTADTLTIDGKTMKVKAVIDNIFADTDAGTVSFLSMYVVLPDKTVLNEIYAGEDDGNYVPDLYLDIDLDGDSSFFEEYEIELKEALRAATENHFTMTAKSVQRSEIYSVYGGLFFLGVYLGVLFMAATVMIIYYKQMSEGYDDKERFVIMKKVGMSDKEIRSTVRRQTLLVFFLPLVTAVIHICFAFRMITKLFAILLMTNVQLFMLCTVLSVIVFAVIYFIVYRLTARAYYRVVNS